MSERPAGGHAERGGTALVTGITGQDGSFLAEELLARGYTVTGLTRREPSADLGAAEPLRTRLDLLQGDVSEPATQNEIVERGPAEIYHLAAPTFVPDSWADPPATMTAIHGSAAALLRLLAGALPQTRLFLANSAEIFGDAPESPQRETTPCRPRTPYASAKLAAHALAGQLRAHAGIYAVSGILYNHESERRPARFVTRRITQAAAEIARGQCERLTLGDLSATRDWSFAGDVMHGAWLSLQPDTPEDYIFASGAGHTVAEFLEAAFAHVGLDPERLVDIDPALVRAPERVASIGDPSRAREQLNWTPTVDFAGLVGRMVDADLARLEAA